MEEKTTGGITAPVMHQIEGDPPGSTAKEILDRKKEQDEQTEKARQAEAEIGDPPGATAKKIQQDKTPRPAPVISTSTVAPAPSPAVGEPERIDTGTGSEKATSAGKKVRRE